MEINALKDINIMPLIGLRGLVVFPYSEITFEIGRQGSELALKAALSTDSYILLVTQKDPVIEDPKREDLYDIGTVCSINKTDQLSGGGIKISIKGLYKARIEELISNDKYMKVSITRLEDMVYEGNQLDYLEALKRHNINAFNEYRKIIEKTNPLITYNSSILETLNYNQLSYVIASELSIEFDKKQALLEEQDPILRHEALTKHINQEMNIMSLMISIGKQVNAKLGKMQRDMFLREQIKVIKSELGEGEEEEIDLYSERLKDKKYPKEVVEKLEKEISRIERLPNSMESQMVRTYIETVLDLPWRTYSRENKNLKKAEEILENDHYGMEKVKERIIEFLAVRLRKKSPDEPILCLYGPPGVGKTSIAKSIARALGKEYVRLALGGIKDEADVRGHRRTYVGALPGRIITALKQADKSNPVMLLDEIDKVGADYRGDPSAALLEVLDGEQNNTFRDHYLELPYDLSRVLFIATANNLDTIPPALLDRMEFIEVPSYTEDEKVEIAKRHLIPKQLEEHGLKEEEIIVSDDILRTIITEYTAESGVRELERTYATILRKAVRIMAIEKKKKIKINDDLLEKMLGASQRKRKRVSNENQTGVCNGLAWTAIGGVIMEVEVNILPGTGKIELTGRLGDVMKESAKIALSYIRSRHDIFKIDEDFYEKKDIHIHVPEGATPKDGPSAGITIATAIVSALTGIPVRANIGMTGEITLRGKVLPIGGLREKTLAALRGGIDTIIIPKDNENMHFELPEAVQKELNIKYVSHMDEVLKIALVDQLF